MGFLKRCLLCIVLFYLPILAPNSLAAAELTNESGLKSSIKAGIATLIEPVPAEPYWYVQTSVLTRHFNPKPEHNNHQKLIGIERNRDDSYIWGGATFLNSFEQRSFYAYGGKRFDLGSTPFYTKLTGGFIHGYKGEYRDKVPFNKFKIAPVILPSIGIKFSRIQADAILLGANALIITVGLGI